MNAPGDYSSQLNQLAHKVRTFRLHRGLNQQDLADISEIGRKTVNRIENESYAANLTTLFALAEALEVSSLDRDRVMLLSNGLGFLRHQQSASVNTIKTRVQLHLNA